MINVFQIKNNHLFCINEKNSFDKAIWIDIILTSNDNEKEYTHIQNILIQHNIKLSTFKNIKDPKRSFTNKNELYIHSFFYIYNKNYQINNSIVSFIIRNNCLYTIRQENFPIFHRYQQSLLQGQLTSNKNVYELFLNLFEIKLDDLSDKIEQIYFKLEKLSLNIMNNQQINEYYYVLSQLTLIENIEWKIRINLLDTEKAILFLINKVKIPSLQKTYAKKILKKISLLLPHNECLLQKTHFLTQSAMGFINIEQNRIIKIFSIIFLPPTLIASSYGMNFEFMPELHWTFGYPIIIGLMILTGLLPYIYFKHKKWF